jgi:hypothetical protein
MWGVSKIFRTGHIKIIKLTIRPIGRHHPRSSFLLHVDTGPSVSSISGTLPGSPFLSECQALSAIRPGSPQWYQTGVLSTSVLFLEVGRSHRVVKSGEYGRWGMTAIFCFVRNCCLRAELWDGALSWWISQVCSRQSPGRRLPTFSCSRRKTSQWNPEFTVWPVGTGASHYHNCCIDGGSSPETFGYHLVLWSEYKVVVMLN